LFKVLRQRKKEKNTGIARHRIRSGDNIVGHNIVGDNVVSIIMRWKITLS